MNPLAIQTSAPSSVSNIVVPKIGTIIPNRIFVGGISSITTEDDLRKFFEKYGRVKDVKIIFDHSILSKGNYGFVTFENQEVAEWLIKHEGESLIFNNRKLNIGHAIRKQPVFQHQLYENGSMNFPNPSISCNMTNEIPCASVNNQTAQISTSYMSPQNVIISQNNSAEVKYDLPPTMSSTGTPVIQIPSNTFAIHREQRNCCPSNSTLIPAGSILLTHASIYIPNGGAVEVLHTPQTQMTTLSQQNGPNERNACSNQQNTNCFQKIKPQEYTPSLNDWPQRRSRFQQTYAHRGEPPFQQERNAPTNINLLQQILLNNCALVENSVETSVVEKYPRNNEQINNTNLGDNKSPNNFWHSIESPSSSKRALGGERYRFGNENELSRLALTYQYSPSSTFGLSEKTSNTSSLFRQWPSFTESNNSQITLSPDRSFNSSLFRRSQYCSPNRIRDQNKDALSDNGIIFSMLRTSQSKQTKDTPTISDNSIHPFFL